MKEPIYASSVEEATVLLSLPYARLRAGGTTNIDFSPETQMIDISHIEGLNYINFSGNRIQIGPLTTIQQIADDPGIQNHLPSLAKAARSTYPTIRERGTIGGNLMVPGDLSLPLLTMNAQLIIQTETDRRQLSLQHFFASPESRTLPQNEWIVQVSVPLSDMPTFCGFRRTQNREDAHGCVYGAALFIQTDAQNRIQTVRAAAAHIENPIFRVRELEKALKHQIADPAMLVEKVRGIRQDGYLEGFLESLVIDCLTSTPTETEAL